jgi:glutamate N-acetyltransferase/amino-acid N-acetyltransferase
VICTSGSANAATGAAGDADQAEIASALAGALGTTVERVLLLSTGIIGTRLPVERVREGIRRMAGRLGAGDDHLMAAAEAFRTTDTVAKVATTAVTVPDPDGLAVRPVRVTGIAKGVGMIHPRMATMLAVLMTDAPVAPSVLHGILRSAATRTWNQLTIDGDTSTNDTVFLLASGATDIAPVAPGSRALATIRGAVTAVARDLARQQAADGEGATTLITCQVSGAVDDMDARAVARAVVSSSLVKAAVHGRDPNWGRIAGAAGNARIAEPALLEAAGLSTTDARERTGQPVIVDPDRLRIAIGSHVVFDGGQGGPVAFDRDAARLEMDVPELLLRVDLGLGDGTGEAFGCDLTEAYVRENSEYTT